MQSDNISEPQTSLQREMCLYQELLECLEEETHALVTAREEAILAAATRKEALLDRLLELKREQKEPLPTAAGHLRYLQRQVEAANLRNREIAAASLEVVQDFLAQFQPPGPGLYRPAGREKSIQEGALFQRRA